MIAFFCTFDICTYSPIQLLSVKVWKQLYWIFERLINCTVWMQFMNMYCILQMCVHWHQVYTYQPCYIKRRGLHHYQRRFPSIEALKANGPECCKSFWWSDMYLNLCCRCSVYCRIQTSTLRMFGWMVKKNNSVVFARNSHHSFLFENCTYKNSPWPFK